MAALPKGPRDRVALLAGVGAPFVVAVVLVPFRDSVDDANVVLGLVLVVVAVAANGYRLAGAVAALSAFAWFDFFFTEPYGSFTIADRAELETAVLLLLVGLGVAELALWGRRQQARALQEAGYLAGIQTAADLGASGTSSVALIHHVTDQLTEALELQDCRFQYGVAGLGSPARLLRDGRVVSGGTTIDVERDGLPVDTDIELLVKSGGRLGGRFLMRAAPDARVPVERRRLAVALADQVGAALR